MEKYTIKETSKEIVSPHKKEFINTVSPWMVGSFPASKEIICLNIEESNFLDTLNINLDTLVVEEEYELCHAGALIAGVVAAAVAAADEM